MSIQDNINKLRMGVSTLTDNVMVGILNSENTGFKYKTNLTSDFLKCVIEYFGDTNMNVNDAFERDINGDGAKYTIKITRIN